MSIHVGMGNAYGVRIVVSASDDFDPTAVTGGRFVVTKSDGIADAVSWVGTLSAQSAASVTLSYTFAAGGGDVDQDGLWTAWIDWTQPGKSPGPRSEPFTFPVKKKNQQ